MCGLPIFCRDMSESGHHGLATSSLGRCRPGARIRPAPRIALHQIVYPSSGAVSVTTPAGTWITPDESRYLDTGRVFGTNTGSTATPSSTESRSTRTRYRRGPATPTVLAVNPLLRELIIACSEADATTTDEHHRRLAVLHDQLQTTGIREPLWIPTPVDGRLRAACALIAENLTQPLTLHQIGQPDRRRPAHPEPPVSRRAGHDLPAVAHPTTPATRVGAARRTPRCHVGGVGMRLGHAPAPSSTPTGAPSGTPPAGWRIVTLPQPAGSSSSVPTNGTSASGTRTLPSGH